MKQSSTTKVLLAAISSLPFAVVALALARPAAAQSWQVITQPGGYSVARVDLAGGIRGVGVTCERGVPVLALNLARSPTRNPAQLTLTSGRANAQIGIIRNGSTNVWVAAIGDPRILDMLANGSSVGIAVDGSNYGTASLSGARAAMGQALAGCYRASGSMTATNASSGHQAPGQQFDDRPMGIADQSSPVTVQASFPTRDSRSGKFRLPVKFGAYVPGNMTCERATEDTLMFVEAGVGVGEGVPIAQNSIEKLRQAAPNTYVITEDVGVNGDSDSTATYVISDPEHFTVRGPSAKTVRYSFCAQERLPIEQRRFLTSEVRKVPAVPIIPGYYRFWDTDETPPKLNCEQRCGFALITPQGIAIAYVSSYSEPKGEITREIQRFARVEQRSPLDYATYTGPGDDSWGVFFHVLSPDNFTSPSDGEGAETHYQRVDPAGIKAEMMPRF